MSRKIPDTFPGFTTESMPSPHTAAAGWAAHPLTLRNVSQPEAAG
jgi:hypothetical protein